MATLGSVPASSRKPASLARVAHLAEQNVQPANDLAPNMTVSPHCLHLTIRFTPPLAWFDSPSRQRASDYTPAN